MTTQMEGIKRRVVNQVIQAKINGAKDVESILLKTLDIIGEEFSVLTIAQVIKMVEQASMEYELLKQREKK